MPASTSTFIMLNFPAHMTCEAKHNEDMEWGIYCLNGWGIYGLNGWDIYGLNGWDIYGLNGWGIYGRVSYCFRVIRSKSLYTL